MLHICNLDVRDQSNGGSKFPEGLKNTCIFLKGISTKESLSLLDDSNFVFGIALVNIIVVTLR